MEETQCNVLERPDCFIPYPMSRKLVDPLSEHLEAILSPTLSFGGHGGYYASLSPSSVRSPHRVAIVSWSPAWCAA